MICCCLVPKLCPTLRLYRLYSTRLLCLWDFWSGLPFPSLGYLHTSGIPGVKSKSPALAGGLFTTEPPGGHRMLYLVTNPCSFISFLPFWPMYKLIDLLRDHLLRFLSSRTHNSVLIIYLPFHMCFFINSFI